MQIFFRGGSLVNHCRTVGFKEEILYGGHFGELASEEFNGQSCAENFAVCSAVASVWWNLQNELSLYLFMFHVFPKVLPCSKLIA